MLLNDFEKSDIEEFYNDFSSLINMIKCLDAAWAEADNELYEALDIFKEYVDKFNEKYPLLKIMFKNTIDQGFRLFIFFPAEKSPVDMFNNAICKIRGLREISSDVDATMGATPGNIKTVISNLKKKLSTFYDDSSIILEINKKEKIPELIYNLSSVDNRSGPEFKLCAYYALKEAKKDIDLKPIRLRFPSIALSSAVNSIGALKG